MSAKELAEKLRVQYTKKRDATKKDSGERIYYDGMLFGIAVAFEALENSTTAQGGKKE